MLKIILITLEAERSYLATVAISKFVTRYLLDGNRELKRQWVISFFGLVFRCDFR